MRPLASHDDFVLFLGFASGFDNALLIGLRIVPLGESRKGDARVTCDVVTVQMFLVRFGGQVGHGRRFPCKILTERTYFPMGIGDALFAFTEWLRLTPLVEFSLWLTETDFSMWLQTNFWSIPTIQTLHILAIATLFGSALFVNLRVLGLVGTYRGLGETAQRFKSWMNWSVVALVLTGSLLIAAEPMRELINPIFWIKMVLVPLAVLIMIPYNRAVAKAETTGGVTAAMRFNSVLLIILWCAIMFAGRWIAYAPV